MASAGYIQDIASQPVMALPVRPEPGEHLRDAAYRAMSQNGFTNSDFALKLAGTRSFKTLSGIRDCTKEEAARLLVVLGIGDDAAATRLSLDNSCQSGRNEMSFFGLELRRGHLATARRVAPLTLRQRNVLKGSWSLRPLSFDLSTMEMLLEKCPVCGKVLGWSRCLGVCFCDHCIDPDYPWRGVVDLRDFPQAKVEVHDEEAFAFLAEVVDPEQTSKLPKRKMDDQIGGLSRGEVFQFIIQIAGRLDGIGRHSNSRLSPISLERASRAIMAWPEEFDALGLDEPGRHDGTKPKPTAIMSLKTDETLSPAVRSLVKERSDKLLRRRLLSRISTLKASPEKGHPGPSDPKRRNFKGELARAAATAGGLHPAEAAVAFLRVNPQSRAVASVVGLPVPQLLPAFENGLLGDFSPLGEREGACRVSPLDTPLIEWVRLRAVEPRPDHTLSLFRAANAIAHMSANRWWRTLAAMEEGNLRFSLIPANSPLLYRIRVHDLDALRMCVSEPEVASPLDLLPLRLDETAQAMGRAPKAIRDLVSHGILPHEPSWADITEMRTHWMFCSEITQAAALSGHSLNRPDIVMARTSAATISAGSTKLWYRADVESCLGLRTSLW
ncbi:hypothetical protein [Gellertiella hungarica]|uniref:TniQ protein n=1 Tax=Gellertiella hungarica TaxID=1572859 RepID=A0A7W6NNC2_9HYPH|nr:hypothetical protein [Gellertiella hungarica]MBB4067237.1 hypothetical protein [Gellertiella hungarica]